MGSSTGIKNNLTATKAPTSIDDLSKGYSIGSTWIFSGTTYSCVDATKATAKWVSSTDVFYCDEWSSLITLISVVGTTYVNKYCIVTNANGGVSSGVTYIGGTTLTNAIVDGGQATYLINSQGASYSVTCQKRTITNPTITSVMTAASTKPTITGYYIFVVVPSNGLPNGCSLNDICYYDGTTWSKFQSYTSASAIVLVGATTITQILWRKEKGSWVTVVPITDVSSSKYIDIGTIRIQWGRGGSGSSSPTITFPVPFKDTTYSFVAMMGSGAASSGFRVTQTGTRTVSSIALTKAFDGGGSTGESVDWKAIGLKP